MVDWLPTLDAGLRHVHSWINGGKPAPSMPPIAMSGERPTIIRDAHGNAQGGVRLPELEVPVAQYGGGGGVNLLGQTDPFSSEEVRRLYPDHATYVARVRRAAEAALQSGVIPPDRAASYIANARASGIPPAP